MLRAAMPEASVDENGETPPRKDNVGADQRLPSANREVLPEPEATSMKLRAKRYLCLGVDTTVPAHHGADCC